MAAELVDYEIALVVGLLELDPHSLGAPPLPAADTPRTRAAAALLQHDLLGAADALVEMGKVNDEAYLRLKAGGRLLAEGRTDEGVDQIERALAFYRGVRGTRFVQEAETLLAGGERQTA